MAQRGFHHRVGLRLPPERVWQALTATDELLQWFARRADVALREGGRYRCETLRLGVRDATIDRCEPGRRLRLIYQPDPRFPVGDAAVVDDLLFEPFETGTRLHVIGGGLPGERDWDRPLRLLRAGWQVALHDLEQYLHGPRHARASA